MNIKVSKFGGTSLCDAKAVKNAARIILSDKDRRAVVVSAPGKRYRGDEKITDLLLSLVNEKDKRDDILDIVFSRFYEMAKELFVDADLSGERRAIISALDNGEDDLVISRGEWICAKIVASAIGYTAVPAEDIIVMNEDGTPICDKTFANISSHCSGKRVVIPGFYGATESGRVKTFPRGGSDITGAIASAALGADVYENFTDVNGFLFADPKTVKDPPVIEKMTYSQARFLSRFGARVLHESTVLYTKDKNIPINIKNSFVPNFGGTLIVPDGEQNSGDICGVSAKNGYALVILRDKKDKIVLENILPYTILSGDEKSALIMSKDVHRLPTDMLCGIGNGVSVLAVSGNTKKAALFEAVLSAVCSVGARVLFIKSESDGVILGIDEKYANGAVRAMTEFYKRKK